MAVTRFTIAPTTATASNVALILRTTNRPDASRYARRSNRPSRLLFPASARVLTATKAYAVATAVERTCG